MNNPTWDLSIFYQDFDDPRLTEDIRSIQPLLQKPQEIMDANLPVVQKLEALDAEILPITQDATVIHHNLS